MGILYMDNIKKLFKVFLIKRGIELTPAQERLADIIIEYLEDGDMLPIGSGKTFLFQLIDEFLHRVMVK